MATNAQIRLSVNAYAQEIILMLRRHDAAINGMAAVSRKKVIHGRIKSAIAPLSPILYIKKASMAHHMAIMRRRQNFAYGGILLIISGFLSQYTITDYNIKKSLWAGQKTLLVRFAERNPADLIYVRQVADHTDDLI